MSEVRPAWWNTVEQHAASAGVPSETLWKIYGVESSFGKNTVSPSSSARGPFQITGDTWNDIARNNPSLALADQNDPEQQARAAPYHMRANAEVLRNTLKREPTDSEHYLAWFAGAAGARAVLTQSDDTPINMVLSPKAIASNPGVFNTVQTVGQLKQWARTKMGDSADVPVYEPAPGPKYDFTPHRAKHLNEEAISGLNVDLQRRLGDLFASAPEDIRKELMINSAYRSSEYQAKLMSGKIMKVLGEETARRWEADVASKGAVAAGEAWGSVLRSNGITKWVALPGRSNHQSGEAVDLGYASDRAKTWVHQNAARFGLHFPMGHEDWHIERRDRKGARPTGAPDVGNNVNLISARPNVPYTQTETAVRQREQANSEWGLAHASWEALKNEGMIKWTIDAMGAGKPDPNFSFTTKDLRERKDLADIPQNHWGYLLDARSQGDLDRRIGRAREELAYEQKMAEKGVTGGLLRVAGAIIDPAGWLVAAASPISGGGYKLGRVGRALAVGAEGAVGNVLAEIPQAMARPGWEQDQLIHAAAGGFLFGTGLGAVFKPHPGIAREVGDLQNAMRSTMQRIETKYGDPSHAAMIRAENARLRESAPQEPIVGGNAPMQMRSNSVGAAQNTGYVEPVNIDTFDFTATDFLSREAGKAAFPGWRFDLAGKTKGDENPLVAALGGRLVEDAVGNIDHTAVHRAASVEQRMIDMQHQTALARAYKQHFDDYLERNPVSITQRGKAEAEFRRVVSDWVENRDPLAPAPDKAVANMAQEVRKFMRSYAELSVNPGKLDGQTMNPLRGAEDLKPSDHYFPHVYNFDGFATYVRRFGDEGMQTLITEAIISANSKVTHAEAKAIAKSFYKTMRGAETGQEVHLSQILGGEKRDALGKFLMDNSGLSKAEVDALMMKLIPDTGDGPTRSRLQTRTILNPQQKVMLKDAQTGEMVEVSMRDIMERDFVKVSAMYSRQLSADVALARLRIENPRWREGDPDAERWMVDGIRSDSDWQQLLNKVRDVGSEMGVKRDVTEKSIERLQFIYDTLKGRQDKMEKGKLGTMLRMLRDYNFIRVMNQVGFSQLGETFVGIAQVGLKAALSQMPGFRSFLRDARAGKVDSKEAEYIASLGLPGADYVRQGMRIATDDTGVVVANNSLQRLESKVQTGVNITSMISGMGPITAYQQRWMARAALARFAMDATGEKALNAKRMRVLGIDEKMQEKIRTQLQKHAGYVEGESGTKLRDLNIEKWDPAARHALEYAIFSWTRKMVQENDLGQLNTLLGSTVGKLMAQFRMFAFAAWTKNTLHNLHMRDFEAASMVLATSFFGSVIYAAQSILQSQGRSDQDKFLEKRLDTKSLAAAAIQRGAWSSLLPMGVDIGTYALGADPIFDTRSTGTPMQGILSNPSVGLIDNVLKAARGGTASLFTDEAYSQKDARALQAALPWGNALPVVWIANSLMQDLPDQDTHRVKNR